MANTTRAMMKLPSTSIGFSSRSFATSSRNILTRAARPSLHQSFRRGYADINTPPIVKKAKRFGWVKFIWRTTYLSAIGGVAYLSYGVWQLRHPDEQFEPDPTKKNLVILGIHSNWDLWNLC